MTPFIAPRHMHRRNKNIVHMKNIHNIFIYKIDTHTN